MASPALAIPPDLTAVEFPISTSSIGTVIATAGATMLIVVFGIMIGFRLVKKLTARATASV
jgi:hypothetical protein